jgi:RHS repeat-associated protein
MKASWIEYGYCFQVAERILKLRGIKMKTTFSTFVPGSSDVAQQLLLASSRFVRWSVLAAICAGTFGNVLQAQNYLTATGVPSFATPYPAEMGTVDASTGSLHLEIPLGSFPQRGGAAPLVPKLLYDSNIWKAVPVDGVSAVWNPNAGGGSFEVSAGYPTSIYPVSGDVENVCDNDWVVTDDSGVQRYFRINSTQNGTQCNSGSAYASDSSGYLLQVTSLDTSLQNYSVTYYAPDGTQMPMCQGSSCPTGALKYREDSNGNYFAEVVDPFGPVGFADTVGRQPLSAGASTGAGAPPWNVANSQNSASVNQYVINDALIPLQTNFGQSQTSECQSLLTDSSSNGYGSWFASCTLDVVTSIVLPDGSKYTFLYDCDETINSTACGSPTGLKAYYGEIISMTLPTGQTVTYGYTNFTDASGNDGRWLTSKTTGTVTWLYTPMVNNSSYGNGWGGYPCAPGNSLGCQQVTVQKPDGSKDIVTYALNNGAWPMTTQSFDTDGATLLSAITNTYDFTQPCTLNECADLEVPNSPKEGSQWVRITKTKTTIPAPGGSITKQTAYTYDSPQTGNVTAIQEWKYQPGTASTATFPSVADRTTNITYATIGPVANNNINRPLSQTVINSSGSQVSQTTIAYDGNALATVTGIVDHDDSNFGTSTTARGNPTQISKWVSGSTYLTTSLTYDTTGQALSVVDPAGNATTYSYADNFYTDNGANPPASFTPTNANGAAIATNAYVTKVTNSIGSTKVGYYYGSGKGAVTSDYNAVYTYAHFMDLMDRPTGTVFPVGWSLNAYISPTQVDSYSAVGDIAPSTGCASCLWADATSDGLGRVTNQTLMNNPAGTVNTSTEYDAMSRPSQVSHPNFGLGDPNDVVETTLYDGLGRSLRVTHPDGQSTWIAYGANVTALGGLSQQQGSTTLYGVGLPVLMSDEAGKIRQEWLDGFGRVLEVDEPSGAGGLTNPYVTNYIYDALGNLVNVVQGVQSRTFQFDGLSRLTRVTTPEAGQVTLSYVNTSGGLCSGVAFDRCIKTDARGITTTYSYDGAGRLTNKSHSDTTGTVQYTYDQGANAIGRLSSMTDPTGSETYRYDVAGRITNLAKVIGTTTYNIGYQYNAGGELTQITYPSGRIVQYSYDNVGHMCVAAASTSSCSSSTTPYLTIPSGSYDAAGHVLSATFGNGVVATAAYSPQRSQLLALNYSKCGSTLFGSSYFYQNNAASCSNGTVGNNGQIQCIQDFSSGTGDSGRSVSYSYDQLARLSTANTTGSTQTQYPAWGLSETYDQYGNRTAQTLTAGSGYAGTFSVNANNNQIVGYSYDASGHLTGEPAPINATYSYDGEDCLTSYSGGATYACDGNHLRVTKNSSVNTVFIYGNGQVIAEYDSGAPVNSPSREYIFGHQRIATVVGSVAGAGGTITYQHRDLLSPRLYTDASGADVGEQGTYPFGESWYNNNTTSNWVFTTYERDPESGDDYALARSYSSTLGRFQSPDPVEGDPSNPQTWNRYAYVGNDPINVTDPTGKDFFSVLFDVVEALMAVESVGSSLELFAADAAADSAAVDAGGNWIASSGPSFEGVVSGQYVIQVNVINTWVPATVSTSSFSWKSALALFPRLSAATYRRIWEAANPGQKVPFDLKLNRFYDMSHIKALADGGTNDASNLQPMQHDEHMASHAADFPRWGARVQETVSSKVEEIGDEVKVGLQDTVNAVEGAAKELITDPEEALREAAQAVKAGEIPIE